MLYSVELQKYITIERYTASASLILIARGCHILRKHIKYDGIFALCISINNNGAGNQDRTDDTRFGRPMLYLWAIPAFILVLSPRIELRIDPYEGTVIPFNYKSIIGRRDGIRTRIAQIESLFSWSS